MPGDSRDPIDARIDAALRSYAEPPASISDARIVTATMLERARQSRARRSFWIWAMPAAACLLALVLSVAVWMFHMRPAPQLARAVPQPPPAISVPRNVAPARASASARIVRRQIPHSPTLPQLDVFPTPAPLSTQEQALVAFARNAPATVKQAVIDDQLHWDQPPSIAPLNISPPEISGIPSTEVERPEKENR